MLQYKLPATSRNPPPCGVILGLLMVAFGAPFSRAQNSLDEIHVMPRGGVSQLSAPILMLPNYESIKPIKVNVNLVLVPVTVTDPMDRAVTGLDREDFEILDGKAPQEIRHFSKQDAPISVGVILDSSGSMKTKIERAREAVTAFLRTGNPEDEFFLITFADWPEEISRFGDSIENMESHLVMSVPKGRTALLDAVYLGISKMRQAKFQKRADGGDNHSRYTEGELKSLVREADVIIYAIGIYDHYFNTMEEARPGPIIIRPDHYIDRRPNVRGR